MTATAAQPAGRRDAGNAPPRAIPFPSRPHVEELCRTRANADNERWQRQVQQRDSLLRAAAQDGFDAGERVGYTQGWHWGLACGGVAGAVAVALPWIVWPQLQALLAWWLA